MPSDLYLIRKNQQWVKYSAVAGLTVTGATYVFGSITGVASTDTITAPGSSLVIDSQVVFTSLTGGSNLVVGTPYWVRSVSGADFTLSATRGGALFNFTTDITAGSMTVQTDEIEVWSSEFRDIFTPIGTQVGQTSPAVGTISTMTGLTLSSPTIDTKSDGIPGGNTSTVIVGTVAATNSDEIAHADLRQTKLPRTAWKFDFGAAVTPRYSYAFIELGDIIANNPPETA
jgi:hypothetical protein